MTRASNPVIRRMAVVSLALAGLLAVVCCLALALGASGAGFKALAAPWLGAGAVDPTQVTIVWEIRLPRVLLAALVGAALSLGGLVFQALLRNPLAEPYILGVSGGSAVGAILGILIGLTHPSAIGALAFAGSMATLAVVLFMVGGRAVQKNTLLLAGVMINAFCSALIMFLVSLTTDSRLHNIMFWLMGNLSNVDLSQVGGLALILGPCFLILFGFSHTMNLLLMGREAAMSMGVNIRRVTLTLLITTSLMVSVTVSRCGLLGFVGLVIPHLLRMMLGADHRVLVPACLLGGGAFMVVCDLLARTLPRQGEMPVGVVTAMIGAPVFIYLLRRAAGKGGDGTGR
ncbi:MAG: iron ABC transporter permease [Pseudomonadota bacterium]